MPTSTSAIIGTWKEHLVVRVTFAADGGRSTLIVIIVSSSTINSFFDESLSSLFCVQVLANLVRLLKFETLDQVIPTAKSTEMLQRYQESSRCTN